MANKGINFQGSDGSAVAVLAVDTGTSDGKGNQLYRLMVDSAVSIDPGDITIGAVKLQNAADATEAEVAPATVITASSNALAVHDAVIGQTNGAKVVTDANGTIQQYLRGLVYLLINTLTVSPPLSSIGVAGAAVVSADASAVPVAVTDAPAAKLVLTGLTLSVGSALTVTFTEETTGTIIFRFYMAANTTLIVPITSKIKLATATKKLMVQTSGAGNISVTPTWYSEA